MGPEVIGLEHQRLLNNEHRPQNSNEYNFNTFKDLLENNDEVGFLQLFNQLNETDRNNQQNANLLIIAMENDLNDATDAILNTEFDVNQTDKNNKTALSSALNHKNKDIIKKLLEKGAYIGTKISSSRDLCLSEINSEILEEYLDSCITTTDYKQDDDKFQIIINCTNFIPYEAENNNNSKDKYKIYEEMLPVKQIADSKDLRHLLQHPVITSFLFSKWRKLSTVFCWNFIIFTIFSASLVTYIVLNFYIPTNEATTIFKGISYVGPIYLVIREITQLLMSPVLFVRNIIANYFEIILILLTIIILLEPNWNKETHRGFAIITIILVAIEFTWLVGSLPVLSIPIHMQMLKTVTKTFLKIFSFYWIFVITFSLCFYILFGEFGNPTEDEYKNDNAQFNNFTSPLIAIFKTTVMLTGEFDASNIKFYSLWSYAIFLLFVIFMSIVLINLLNGLAVSDTQAIKAQAELNHYISLTKLLTKYEKQFVGNRGNSSNNGICRINTKLKAIYKKIFNLFPRYSYGVQATISIKASNEISLDVKEKPKSTMDLRPECSGAVNVSVPGPPQTANEKLQNSCSPLEFILFCFDSFTKMDNRIIRTSLDIIEKRRKHEERNNNNLTIEKRLTYLENGIDEILYLLKKS